MSKHMVALVNKNKDNFKWAFKAHSGVADIFCSGCKQAVFFAEDKNAHILTSFPVAIKNIVIGLIGNAFLSFLCEFNKVYVIESG